jgi:hypothetical protein
MWLQGCDNVVRLDYSGCNPGDDDFKTVVALAGGWRS